MADTDSLPPAVEDFFATKTEKDALYAGFRTQMEEFVSKSISSGRALAVVTSGGTAVPLERNTVRFLDNFSTGTRGALCTERLLKSGYCVIMLRRDSSKRPFRRAAQAFLDSLTKYTREDESRSLVLTPPSDVCAELVALKEVETDNQLLEIPFNTVTDYLHLLRHAGEASAAAGKSCLFLLAAAVSDFFVPPKDMVEHKIQSKGGSSSLQLSLQGVPKLLKVLRKTWSPEAFLVSFKLETDTDLLLPKAQAALEGYEMNMVAANLLSKRYEEMHLVEPTGPTTISCPSGGTIEDVLIDSVVTRHLAFAGLAGK